MSYIPAPIPKNELQRLAELYRYEVLDSESEREFDELTLLAAEHCGVPMSVVSLVDKDRQWFKSKVGIELDETPREYSFCAHAILDDKILLIEDAHQDERFRENPLVVGPPGVRFYAGVPLRTASGHTLGAFCVIDSRPRSLSPLQLKTISVLADQVMTQLELRLRLREVEGYATRLEALAEQRAQQLAHTERLSLIGTMCTGVAHEINNPMTFISGNVRFLEHVWNELSPLLSEGGESLTIASRELYHAEVPRALSEIRHGVSRITKIVKGLQSFSRKGELGRVTTDINEIVKAVLIVATPGIPSEVSLRTQLDPSPRKVVVDAQQIEQVLLNLIFNARDALVGREGEITIRTVSDGLRTVTVEVEDDGLGISEKNQKRIWEPFFTTKDPGKGTGLGLPISLEIAERHGGSIKLESREGRGARFILTLPISE